MTRRAGALAAVLLLAALCTGCAPFIPQNVNNLLRAPALTAAQSQVQSALKAYLGGQEPLYKYPRGGSLHSPLLWADLNGDGTQEAVLLYSLDAGADAVQEKAGYVNVAVLENADGTWQVTCNEPGLYTDVASIEAADLLGGGARQLIIGYATAGLNAKMLALYTYKDSALVREYEFDYSLYEIGDFTGTGSSDLLVVSRGEQDGGLQLYFVRTRDGAFVRDGGMEPVPLDVNFDSCAGITLSAVSDPAQDSGRLLVVDGTTKNTLTSELVYYTDTPVERFFTLSDTNPLRGAASRSGSLLVSRDIDGDGVVEIPLRVGRSELSTPRGDKRLEYIEWMDFTASVTEPRSKQFGLFDSDRGVYVRLPDSWRGGIRVTDGEAAGEWQVQDGHSMAALLSLSGSANGALSPDMLPVPGGVARLQIHSAVKPAERDLITVTSLTGF